MPVERTGVYVPGGRYPLFSSLLMGVIPAKTAGVREIAVFSPPYKDGLPHPSVLAAANLAGVDEVYALGGAQAIAAMAYGTKTIKKVDVIVGPGNRWVTEAKRQIFGTTGIDMTAGPSEILVIADKSCDAELAAAYIYAQAEHDSEAVPVLAAFDRKTVDAVSKKTRELCIRFDKTGTATQSLERNSAGLIFKTRDEAVEFADRMAPEHLQLHVDEPDWYRKRLSHYGSLFCGSGTAEVLGDYVSGLNHTLPTGGTARFTNGMNIWTFLKRETVLRDDGCVDQSLYADACALAEVEGLDGHSHSAKMRMY